MTIHRTKAAAGWLLILLAGCGSDGSHGGEKPAKVDPVAHESELMRITLTPAAERRLGIALAPAADVARSNIVAAHGEVVIPPIAAGGLPITSTTDLAALSVNQARADGDVARAAAQARVARINADRTEALVREQAGSSKARDDALAAAAVAEADLATARAQRRLLGAPVASLGRQATLWIRVSVLAADVARIDRGASAAIEALGTQGMALSARPIAAPPSANASAGSIDLYYALPNRGGLRPGERVAVALPVIAVRSQISAIPTSAVLHDAYGGQWVYIRIRPHSYERRRIQVAAIERGWAMLAMGLTGGEQVVIAGAAELFGTEFGAK